MDVQTKLSKVKAKLILEQPFFGAIVCNLPLIEDATIPMPTMCTNGEWIRYHPDFVKKCSFDELLFVLCHEVLHVAFQHMCRLNGRDTKRWNYATDYIINDLLTKENIGSMPQGGLLDPNIVQKGNGTAEGVYELIPIDPEGSGKGPGGGEGKPLDELVSAGNSAAANSEAATRIKVMVAQAAQAAKMCGKLSAGMERFIDGALRPKVDWRDVLRRFVSARAKVDATFARPKRRFIDMDLYLPSLTGEKLGDIVVAVDCSGSVGPKELSEFAAEIRAIKEDMLPATTHVVYFDSDVCHHDSFGPDDELEVAPHGGGGTAFSPIFRFVDDQDIEPVACVVLTDLYCDDFGPATDYPTLWVTTAATKAPWGDVVEMNPR